MIKLASLLQLATSIGVDSISSELDIVPIDGFIDEIRPFVFSYEEGEQVGFEFALDEIPSLPFSACSIELEANGALYVPDFGTGQFWVMSYVCREVSPGNYDFYALGSVDGISLDAVVYVNEGALHQHLLNTTIQFIKRLKIGKTGLCKSRARIKHRVRNKKAFTTIKNYIYVTGNRMPTVSGYGDTIEYTHAFEVGGHWRKIKGIGLNRLGERVVGGATWVRPYTKGMQATPLLVKTRYVG